MRSPLLLLLAGVAAAVLVTGAVLVWAVPGGRPPDTASPGEVVVGESPGVSPASPSNEEVVAPPPPVTDHDGDGTPDSDDPDHAEPSVEPSPPPSEEPGQTPTATCGDDDDDDDDDGVDDCDDEDDDDDD